MCLIIFSISHVFIQMILYKDRQILKKPAVLGHFVW